MDQANTQHSRKLRQVPVPIWYRVAIVVLFLYPLIAGLCVHSEPVVFFRYSAFTVVLSIWNLALLLLILLTSRSNSFSASQICWLLLILTTYVIPLDDAIQRIWGMWLVLPSLRVVVAWAMIAAVFRRYCSTRRSSFFLAIAALVLFSSAVDVVLLLWIEWSRPSELAEVSQFRKNYDLASIGPDDTLLIGDSFVWGYGVAQDEAFGAVLQRLYAEEGRSGNVYSLGMKGAGMKQYVEFLQRVPARCRADRVVLAFFLNDIAPRRYTLRSVHAAVFLPAIGRGCPTLRLVGELLLKRLSFTADEYVQQIVVDYQHQDGSFRSRWSQLTANLRRFQQLSTARSKQTPLFVILPLMVEDFDRYPAREVHRELAELAVSCGFDVLDLLPAFQEQIQDGSRHRISKDDIHFDAFVHDLVARMIKEHCDRRDSPSTEASQALDTQAVDGIPQGPGVERELHTAKERER